MITHKRLALWSAAVGAGLAAVAIAIWIAAGPAVAQPRSVVPSPVVSDVQWCTSEAPPTSYPGGPSYLPQCPSPYVSPTGSPRPFSPRPSYGHLSPPPLPGPRPSATGVKAGCA